MAISALFIDPLGPYPQLVADCWDKARDARQYAGPNPIVAHPPCNRWVNFAALNYARWGGEHNRPGNDGGCFDAALAAVRKWGGVLEHPAFSLAWKTFALARPRSIGWLPCRGTGEWVCEVWQSAYGHRARKRTWLLYVGDRAPFELNWARNPGTHQIGFFDRNKPVLCGRAASESPIAFARELVRLAEWSRNG